MPQKLGNGPHGCAARRQVAGELPAHQLGRRPRRTAALAKHADARPHIALTERRPAPREQERLIAPRAGTHARQVARQRPARFTVQRQHLLSGAPPGYDDLRSIERYVADAQAHNLAGAQARRVQYLHERPITQAEGIVASAGGQECVHVERGRLRPAPGRRRAQPGGRTLGKPATRNEKGAPAARVADLAPDGRRRQPASAQVACPGVQVLALEGGNRGDTMPRQEAHELGQVAPQHWQGARGTCLGCGQHIVGHGRGDGRRSLPDLGLVRRRLHASCTGGPNAFPAASPRLPGLVAEETAEDATLPLQEATSLCSGSALVCPHFVQRARCLSRCTSIPPQAGHGSGSGRCQMANWHSG